MKEALFYTRNEDGTLRCTLCPHLCIIKEGAYGRCLSRRNINSRLYSLNYANISSIALDPIEKKPLYHVHPGKMILSIGGYGCNLNCPFCQNYHIARAMPKLSPIEDDKLIEEALSRQDNIGIAFTYNEPMINFEYILDLSKKLKEKNLKTVLVTNGYINEEPLRMLAKSIDAANVDLKGYTEEFYKDVCGADLETVKRTISILIEEAVHVEVTFLLIPTLNDDEDRFEEMLEFLSSLGKPPVLHISRYFPNYKMDLPPTDISLVKEFAHIAKRKLDHVYAGNIGYLEDTYCRKCSGVIIQRSYDTKVFLDEEGRCHRCKEKAEYISI